MRNLESFDMRSRFRTGIDELGHRWGWYFALGIVLMVLGVAAATYAYYTTVASVLVFGWILLVAGVALGFLSFMTGRWSGFLLSLSAGILSAITGIMLLRAPVAGATVLTLVIATFLIVSGIFRAIASLVMQYPNWGWSLLSGIVAAGLGVILYQGWPVIGLWFLGFYVGVDLIIHGFSWCMFGLSVRNIAKRFETDIRQRPAA